MSNLYIRENYLKNIRGFYHDVDMIKVISGVRRCGKSSLMEMIKDELIKNGISTDSIIFIHLDKKPYKSIKNSRSIRKIDWRKM